MASSGSNQQPAAKRPRYSAKSVKMRADKTKEGALAPLQVAVHSLGPDCECLLPWTNPEHSTLATAGDARRSQWPWLHDEHLAEGALPKFRGGAATTLESMERLHGIKYTARRQVRTRWGWIPALAHCAVVAGPTCDAGLELLGLVVERKIEIGHLVLPPEMQVIGREVEFPHCPLPAGWRYVQTLDVPTPFAALPLKSRRHLWMQVELPQESAAAAAAAAAAGQQPTEEEDAATPESWVVMFYGGVYDYRDRFEALNIEGGQIEEDSDTKNFVRMLTTDLGNESKKLLSAVLGDAVFCHAPVALLNATGADDDKLVAWLTDQTSVHLQMEAVE